MEDKCLAGVCAGVDKCASVDCSDPKQCFAQGECNKYTGLCSSMFEPAGAACDDFNEETAEQKQRTMGKAKTRRNNSEYPFYVCGALPPGSVAGPIHQLSLVSTP